MRHPRLCALPMVLLLLAARAPGQPPGSVRAQLTSFESALDQAVGGLGAGAMHVFGAPARCHGYYLEGYGAIFVLPPRQFGGASSQHFVLQSEFGPGLEAALAHLEEGLHRIESPEARAVLGETLADLRERPAPPPPAQPPAAGTLTPMESDLRDRLATARGHEEQASRAAREASAAARASRAAAGPDGSPETVALERAARAAEARRQAWAREVRGREAQLRALESQVEAFRVEAEHARQEAERQLEVISHQIRLRFGAPLGEAAPGTQVELPAPQAPWAFWYETRTQRTAASPEALVANVREALVATLDQRAGALPLLGPDEFVVVAVDFVPSGIAGAGDPQRSLVLKIRQKHLQDRVEGRITAEALRERIEFSEY